MRNIVFLSDLHIGDGSSKDDFNQDELFESLVLEWNKLENPEIVIVGDGFEILESDAIRNLGLISFWECIEKLDESIINDIEKAHPKIFQSLNRFNGTIWYVMGNHDYYIFKNQNLQEALKSKIKNLEIVPYYYDEQSSILAIHGNQFDSINKFKEIDGELITPLGDFIARYMMVNFDEDLKKHLPEHVIKDYDNVRPTLDVFLWLEKIADVYENSIDLLKLWIDNFIEMMREEEAQKWMKKNYPVMSKLSIVFLNKFGGIKLGELIVRTVMSVRKVRKTDYLKKAADKIFKNPQILKKHLDGYIDISKKLSNIKQIDGLIFGHSHRPAFEITKVDGQLKFYMNCGSWRPVVERRSHGMFQRYFEIFYGVAKIDKSDVEIIIGTINKIKKREVID